MPWKAKTHKPIDARIERKMQNAGKKTKKEMGYDWEWTKYSRAYLQAHPLCVICLAAGIRTPSEHTDHIIPHRNNMLLFWDPKNHQALCRVCHGVKTATEDGGFGNAM